MKSMLSMIQDGSGNVSAMRVVMILVIVCVMVPPAIAAIRTGGTVQWTQSDLAMIGAALAGKLWQNNQEATASSSSTSSTTETKQP